MNKKLNGLLFISFALLLQSCASAPSEDQVRAAAIQLLTEQAETEAASIPPTNTARPATSTPRPTVRPQPTSTPRPEFGSRQNPVPLRTSISLIYDQTMEFDISIDETHRGDAAWQLVRAANSFNDSPREGYEYIAIFITVVYTNGPADEVLELDEYDFEVISGNQVISAFDDTSVVVPDPEFDATLFSGGSASGWIVVEVKIDDPSPLLALGRDSSNSGFYFSLSD